MIIPNQTIFEYERFKSLAKTEMQVLAYLRAMDQIKKRGAFAQCMMLLRLYRHGSMTTQELFMSMEFTPYRRLVDLLKMMQQKGLVASHQLKRGVRLRYLTPEGKEMAINFQKSYQKAIKLTRKFYEQEYGDIWDRIRDSEHATCQGYIRKLEAKKGSILPEDRFRRRVRKS